MRHVTTVKGVDQVLIPQDISEISFPEYSERIARIDPEGVQQHHRQVQQSLETFRESLLDYLQRKVETLVGGKLKGVEGGVTDLKSFVQSLESNFMSLDESLNGISTAIRTLETSVATNGDNIEAIALDVTELETQVTDNTNGLAGQSTALSALTTRVTTNEGEIEAVASDVVALISTVNNETTGVSATSTALSALTTRVTTNEGEIEAVSTNTSNLSSQVNHATTGLPATTARVGTIESTYATQSFAEAKKSEAISAAAADATAKVNAETIARTSAGYAFASEVNTLSTTVDGHTNTISQHATSINGIMGNWGVTINANGRISGIKLIGTDTTGQFIVDADLIVNGTIVAEKIANLAIPTEKIANNAITTFVGNENNSFQISSGNQYQAASCAASNNPAYKAIILASVQIDDSGSPLTDDPRFELWITRAGENFPAYVSWNRQFSFPRGKKGSGNLMALVPTVDTSQYELRLSAIHVNGVGTAVYPSISIIEFKK